MHFSCIVDPKFNTFSVMDSSIIFFKLIKHIESRRSLYIRVFQQLYNRHTKTTIQTDDDDDKENGYNDNIKKKSGFYGQKGHKNTSKFQVFLSVTHKITITFI